MSESIDVRVARMEEKIDSIKALLEQAAGPDGFTRCAARKERLRNLESGQTTLKKLNAIAIAALIAVLILIGPEKIPAVAALVTSIF